MHSAGQTLEGIQVCLTVSSECCPTLFHNQVRIFCYITKTVTVNSIFSVSFSSFHFPVFHLFLLTAANIFLTQQHASCVSWHRDKSGSCHLSKRTTRVVNVRHKLTRARSRPHAQTHKGQQRRDKGGESEPWELQKRGNKSRRERMARTAWHLNRGFPLCTLSSLRSFCLHKERLFHIAPMRVQVCIYACILSHHLY